MRPLRFPGRFRWWIVAVLAVIFGFPLFPLAAWLAWEMPPLQRYYLLNYLDSTERAKQPGKTTEVQWVYKTASGRKSTLATNPDVVSENSADPPVRLSEAAIADGWTGIEKHAPVRVDSAQLEQFLQEDIYSGRGYWRLMLEPILFGFALMLFLIAGGLQLKEWLGGTGSRHEQRHGRRTRGAGTACPLAMELEAEARRHPLAIALAEFPARLVQQTVAQLGHSNLSYAAQSRSQPHPINGRLEGSAAKFFGHPANPPPDCSAGRDGHRLRPGAGVHAGVLLVRARRSDSQPTRYAVPLLGHRR